MPMHNEEMAVEMQSMLEMMEQVKDKMMNMMSMMSGEEKSNEEMGDKMSMGKSNFQEKMSNRSYV